MLFRFWVFPDCTFLDISKMYHPDSVVTLHKRILKDAGLEHIRFHDLRHPYVKHTTKNKATFRSDSTGSRFISYQVYTFLCLLDFSCVRCTSFSVDGSQLVHLCLRRNFKVKNILLIYESLYFSN